MYICVSDYIFSDKPYNITDEPWEYQLTRECLIDELKQVDCVQRAASSVISFMHKPEDSLIVREALIERGYTGLQNFYWHKKDHHSPTHLQSLTSSVEMGTIAYFPSRNKVNWNAEPDPRKRHNFFECKAVTDYLTDDAGRAINVCEKPPELIQWLIRHHVKPGGRVLILGFGAGGDVMGVVDAKLNVTAVESDRRQFDAVQARLVQRLEEEYVAIEDEKQSLSQSQSSKKGQRKTPPSQTAQELSDELPFPAYTISTCIECNEQIVDPDVEGETCTLCDPPCPVHIACMPTHTDHVFDDSTNVENVAESADY